jgi:hypothetical protein
VTHVACYLPLEQRMFNTGGSDGAGLCVYSSVTMAARYQNETKLFGLRAYAEKRPGGAWPAKLKKDIDAVAPDCKWLQCEGKDMAFVRAAINSGRMVSLDIMGGQHMVDLIHLDDKWACLMDNNAVYNRQTKADSQLIWLDAAKEFPKKWHSWAVVLLAPPPPPAVIASRTQTPLPDAPDWSPPRLVWTCDKRNPGQAFLSKDGVDLGGYDFGGKIWRDWSANKWGPATRTPPHAPPDWADMVEGRLEILDHGCRPAPQVDVPRYLIDGKEITRAEAFEAIGQQCPNCPQPKPGPKPGPKQPSPGPSPVIPDDGGKLHLTVVGDTAGTVAKDWASAPELQPWTSKVLFQNYAAGDPALTAAGLPSTGFHVLIQLPKSGQFPGKIVANYTTYAGPAALAAVLAKLDPNAPPAPPAPVTPPPEPVPAPSVSPPAPAPATPTDTEGDDLVTVLGAIAAALGAANSAANRK